MSSNNLYIACLACCVLACILQSGVPALADGRLVLKPSVATGISYESNYFLAEEDERAVTMYHLRPGLEFGYTTAKSNLFFDYVLDANWFDEAGSAPLGELSADELDFVGHDMKFSADTQATDRIKIAVADDFILSRDPDQLDYYSNEVIRNKYAKNRIEPQIDYQFGEKMSFLAGYRNTSIDYREGPSEDSTENRGLFRLTYDLNSLNAIDLDYQYWAKDYDGLLTNDYSAHQALLNFTRALKYYEITLSGGYQHRSFDGALQDDLDQFVWGIALSGTRPQMRFALSQNINDTAVASEYYLATRFTAEIGHLFAKKIDTRLRGYYQFSDYQQSPDGREDNSGGVSVAVNYLRSEIFSIGIETGYYTRDSSVAGNDYDNFYAMAGIKFNYDFGAR